MEIQDVLEAVAWAAGITLLSQLISVGVMAFFGLPFKKLRQAIEDEQNPAVGAFFFIIALAVSLYLGPIGGDPRQATSSTSEEVMWIGGGALLILVYLVVIIYATHELMVPEEGENAYMWIKREVVAEQNASLAFFLGALIIPPVVATVYQVL